MSTLQVVTRLPLVLSFAPFLPTPCGYFPAFIALHDLYPLAVGREPGWTACAMPENEPNARTATASVDARLTFVCEPSPSGLRRIACYPCTLRLSSSRYRAGDRLLLAQLRHLVTQSPDLHNQVGLARIAPTDEPAAMLAVTTPITEMPTSMSAKAT